jgi:hypothetical protein
MASLLTWGALAFTILAALLGLRAARVTIRDNQDEFIGDLGRQGRWASLAAIANAIAVGFLVAAQFVAN